MSDVPPAPSTPARSRGLIIALAVVAGMLLVAGIVLVVLLVTDSDADSGGSETQAPTPSATAAPSSPAPTPTVTPTVAPAFVMPSCAAVAVPDIPDRVAAGELVEITRDNDQQALAGSVPGPVAAEAALASPQVRSCLWGPPNSDGGFIIWMAEMPQATWDTFAEQLAGGGWTATDVDGAPAFTQTQGVDPLSGEPAEWWYIHTSGAWIVTMSTPAEVRSAAVEGMRAANP